MSRWWSASTRPRATASPPGVPRSTGASARSPSASSPRSVPRSSRGSLPCCHRSRTRLPIDAREQPGRRRAGGDVRRSGCDRARSLAGTAPSSSTTSTGRAGHRTPSSPRLVASTKRLRLLATIPAAGTGRHPVAGVGDRAARWPRGRCVGELLRSRGVASTDVEAATTRADGNPLLALVASESTATGPRRSGRGAVSRPARRAAGGHRGCRTRRPDDRRRLVERAHRGARTRSSPSVSMPRYVPACSRRRAARWRSSMIWCARQPPRRCRRTAGRCSTPPRRPRC